MALENINRFLDRYRSLLKWTIDEKAAVHEVIKNVCGIDIPQTAIIVEKGVIAITASSTIKNELFIRKEAILEALNKGENKKRFYSIS